MKHVHLEQSPREGLGEGCKEGAFAEMAHMQTRTLTIVLTVAASQMR
jgi:hypothetical protein